MRQAMQVADALEVVEGCDCRSDEERYAAERRLAKPDSCGRFVPEAAFDKRLCKQMRLRSESGWAGYGQVGQ